MARILLVDDEKIARSLYSEYLLGAGHEVSAVGAISDAKQMLQSGHFDVVVTDLLLPEGNGMEVLQHTKEHHPGTDVIVITALDKVDPAVRAIKSGASEYLVKPVAPEALAHAVSRTLTTQKLFRENESLRSHVALLETGQRIATTLDRERLVATACTSFAQATGADAVLLYLRSSAGNTSCEGSSGLGEEELAALTPALDAQIKTLASARNADATRGAPLELPPDSRGYAQAQAFAAVEGDAVLGYTALLFRKGGAELAGVPAAYLSRHLGLALRNIGRFAEVEDLAYLDDLTHLFNVRYLELVLDREVKSAQQTQKPFSLLFLDLDYFKSVNDTHGHLVGSKLLVEVARVLKACVRDNDVVARYGGDEYVILLRGTDSGGALKVGERIRRTIESHHFLAREGYSLTVTTCIGVASFPEHAQDKSTLLDFADRAMYRGKKGTRNVIYMAAKGLEATPAQRHSPTANGAPAGEGAGTKG